MKKFLLVCALCMSFGLASDALGQGRDNRGGRNEIRRGVRSGQLTRAAGGTAYHVHKKRQGRRRSRNR